MKTSYGLEYELVREIPDGWNDYHKSVARAHLANWNCIVVDVSYGFPIDNEFDLAAIEEESGLS